MNRPKGNWSLRFVRAVLVWLIPVAVVWVLATPWYNAFLTTAGENLVRLTEDPSVTRLLFSEDKHHFLITRTDVASAKGPLGSVRITDTHFPLLMLWAFFLAVPGVPWRKRMENFGWATLIAIFFHIISLFCWVKFVYATQLGAWSAENYNTFQINFWGMAKHLLDLPFKLALPLVVWAAFYFRLLLPNSDEPR